jgi:predicted kinase
MASAKTLILLRGLPGSGKSTFAAILSEDGKYPVYCIDDYFTDPKTGTYTFDFANNFKAYRDCEERTEKSMQSQKKKIIVENVFSLEWEMEPYFQLAKTYAYQVHVMTMENRHGGENIHGIDREKTQRIADKFKVKLF